MKLTTTALLAIIAGAQAASHIRGLADDGTTLEVCNFMPFDKSLVFEVGDKKSAALGFNGCGVVASPPTGSAVTVKVMDGTELVKYETQRVAANKANVMYIRPVSSSSTKLTDAEIEQREDRSSFSLEWLFEVHNVCQGNPNVTINGEVFDIKLAEQTVTFGAYKSDKLTTDHGGSFTIAADGVGSLKYSGKPSTPGMGYIFCTGIKGDTGDFKPSFQTVGVAGPFAGAAGVAAAVAGWVTLAGASVLLSKRM